MNNQDKTNEQLIKELHKLQQKYDSLKRISDKVLLKRPQEEEALRESENSIRAKLDAILLPEGNLDALVLEDILDLPAVRGLMENIFKITGIAVALGDLNGKALVAFGWQDVCTQYHRKHPVACKNCTESDTFLASHVEPGTFKMYKCKNNLWDVASPIYVGGRHVGSLFIGQFFCTDEVPDIALFKTQAKLYGFNEVEYLSALDRVPRVSRETVSALAMFYTQFSAIISNLSYSSIQFARMLNEREQAEITLNEKSNILRKTLQLSYDLINTKSGDINFGKITDNILEISGAKYATFNVFDENGLDFTTVALSGIKDKILKASSYLGFEIINKKWKHDAVRANKIKGNIITKYNSLHELTGTVISPNVSSIIEKIFDLGNTYVVVINHEDKPIGDFTLLFSGNNAVQNIELVELFANQIGLLIERNQSEVKIKLKNEELSTINAEKDKFFSIIAHDLKSPFNSIIGFSNLIAEQIKEKDYEGIEKYAEIVQQSSNRAMDLLINLMEWSQSQTGRMKYNPEHFELVKIIKDTELLLSGALEEKSISITKNVSSNLPIFADKKMIATVLRNLISNAIKFTHPGGKISILYKKKQNELIVSVSDSGVGISKEKISKLFLISEGYSTPGTKNENGTGLGLILCKDFIEKHGGKIWVESEEGKGSTFYFTIPYN